MSIERTNATPVGMPTHEMVIQNIVRKNIQRMLPPGKGRQLLDLSEIPCRSAYPDLLAMHVSRTSLEKSIRRGITFANETQCKVAAIMLQEPTCGTESLAIKLGLSAGHTQKIIRTLEQQGTLDRIREIDQSSIVHGSWIVESKVRDWKSAIVQARRYRGLVAGVAIAVPLRLADKLDPRLLSRLEVGVLGVDRSDLIWYRRPDPLPVSLGSQLWLAELARRKWLDAFDAPKMI